MSKLVHILLFAGLFALVLASQAQNERIQYTSEVLYNTQMDGKSVRRLIGNVVFKQKTSTMYCDSAYYYVRENVMEAFGSVKIVDDSVTITSNKLIYDGKDQSAKLRENVVYTKADQRLTTDFLDYNMDSEIGNYFNGGKLKDSVNLLTSEIAYYYGKANYAVFWNDVVLTAPTYVLKSDTLRYNTIPKVATTEGKTTIITEDESILHAKGGIFKTQLDQSEFIDGNVETTDYYMEGDELFFDDLKKYYDATGNVRLTAKTKDVVITGDEGYSDERNQISKVYGNAVMRRYLELDTLYIAADTLVSIESKYDSAKRILAYHNVRVWKNNLQGLADSAAYFLGDSLLHFYEDPIFWNKNNQIEGDTIIMEITEKEIKSMELLQRAFLATEDTLHNYNQIKGRTMMAYFERSKIMRVEVNGNGESIYYVLDDKDSTDIITMGMNRILCSNMTIRFVNEELDNISFYIRPDARFIPPHELTPEVQVLDGFEWRGPERPSLEDLFTGGMPNLSDTTKMVLPQLPPEEPVRLEKGAKQEMKMLKTPKGKGE